MNTLIITILLFGIVVVHVLVFVPRCALSILQYIHNLIVGMLEKERKEEKEKKKKKEWEREKERERKKKKKKKKKNM